MCSVRMCNFSGKEIFYGTTIDFRALLKKTEMRIVDIDINIRCTNKTVNERLKYMLNSVRENDCVFCASCATNTV